MSLPALVSSKTERVLAFCCLLWKQGSGECTRYRIPRYLKDLAEKSCKYLLCYEWLWAIEGKEKQNRFCLSLIFLSPSEIWKIPPENSILTWPHKPMSYVFKLAARSREKWLFCYKSGVLYGDKTSLNAGGEKSLLSKVCAWRKRLAF